MNTNIRTVLPAARIGRFPISKIRAAIHRVHGKYKIETDDVTVERITTRYLAIQLARDSSIFTDCEVTVHRENPMWLTGDQLKLGQWVYIGFALNGVFYVHE